MVHLGQIIQSMLGMKNKTFGVPMMETYIRRSSALCLLAQATLAQYLTDTVGSLDASFLVEPVAGEQFDTHEACFIRLQGYVLSQGFAIVALTSKAKEAQFGCIRHGEKPRNTHGLEKYVVKDEEGNILT